MCVRAPTLVVLLHLPLQLDSAPLSSRHKYREEAAKDPMGLKARVQKVTSEMAGVLQHICRGLCSSVIASGNGMHMPTHVGSNTNMKCICLHGVHKQALL
jgi:hypothetical protein